MTSLCWRDVDLAGGVIRLRPENSKNSQPRLLPLRGELLAIIQRAASTRRLGCPNVFTRFGKPMSRVRNAWVTACRAAGLGAILIHDLRRSGVGNLVRAGVPEKIAMGISGHKTRSVFDRYNITSEEDLIAAMDRVTAHLANQPVIATNVIQISKKTA